MLTFGDLGRKITEIQEAANKLEVCGLKNAYALVQINDRCNEMINMINEAVREIQNGSAEGSEKDGEQN